MNDRVRLHLSPTKLANFVRHGFCHRYLLKAGEKRQGSATPPAFDNVLRRRGVEAQAEVERLLTAQQGWVARGEVDFEQLLAEIEDRRRTARLHPLVFTEVRVDGMIGPAAFGIGDPAERPRIDFVLLTWPPDKIDVPLLTIVECKSSLRDRMEHYIQLGAYYALVRDKLAAHGQSYPVDGLIVWRPAPGLAMPVPALQARALDRTARDGLTWLSTEELESLAIDIGAQLKSVARRHEAEPVQFAPTCSGCAYNGACLSAALARPRSLELLCLQSDQQEALALAGVRWDNRPEWSVRRQTARNLGFRGSWSALAETHHVRQAYYRSTTLDEEVRSTGFARLPDVDGFVKKEAPFLQVFIAADHDYDGRRFSILALRAVLHAGDGQRHEIAAAVHAEPDEAALIAAFARSLAAAIGEALHRVPSGIYVHLYAWRHEELAALAKRCLELIDRHGVDLPDIKRLLHFLTRHEGLSRLDETEELDAEESWEERVFTGLAEEAARRLHLGAVGTTLIEASCLRWRAGDAEGLASAVWLQDRVLVQHLPAILGLPDLPQPTSGNDLRDLLRRRMHFFDSCPPEMAERMHASEPLMRAWLNARTAALALVEQEFRNMLDKSNLPAIKKIIHTSNYFQSADKSEEFTILEAASEYLSLDTYYKIKSWYAGLLFSPDDLVARDKAVMLDKLVWTQNSRNEPRPLGWKRVGLAGRLDPREAELFRQSKPLPGRPRLIPYRDPNERLHIDDVTKNALASSGINWPNDPDGHQIDGDLLGVPFKKLDKISNRVKSGNKEIYKGAARFGSVFPNQSVLCVPDFYQSPAHDNLLAWFRSGTAQPDIVAPAAWFDLYGDTPLPPAPPLNPSVSQTIRGILEKFSTISDETRKPIIAHYKERAAVGEGRLSYGAEVLGQVLYKMDAVPRQFDTTSDAAEMERRERVWTLILKVLGSRVSLLQGPPGTGKTEVGTRLVLAWLTNWSLDPSRSSREPRIIVTACTHKALENIVERVVAYFSLFRDLLPETPGPKKAFRLRVVKIAATENLMKLADYSDQELSDVEDEEGDDRSRSCHLLFRARTDRPDEILQSLEGAPILPLDAGLIAGGTRLGFFDSDTKDEALRQRAFETPMPTLIAITASRLATITRKGFFTANPADLLLIDEASMLVLPDFLAALPALETERGQIVMIGDDRQLGPIVSNAWGDEIRPLIRRYRPYGSAFSALRRAAARQDTPGSFMVDGLDYCYRCARDVWRLVAPIYVRDGIVLKGDETNETAARRVEPHALLIGQEWKGVRLITYDSDMVPDLSTDNAVEAEIIRMLCDQEELMAKHIGIVTPYNKQISLISSRLRSLGKAAGAIPVATVNRFQGDERDTMIVSAVGTRRLLESQEEFLLELNRTNVAFTRAINRLIVICSRDMLDYVARTAENYEASLIWKRLRDTACVEHSEFDVPVGSVPVRCKLFGTAEER